MNDLPRPVSTDQYFLARIVKLLAEQKDLLRQVLAGRTADQPEPAGGEPSGPQPVELREPELPVAPAAEAPPAEPQPKPTRRPRAAKKGT